MSSAGIACGVIGGQVYSLSFLISSSERIATMTNVAATFSFTTSAGGELYFGSTITLMFSSGFFVASAVGIQETKTPLEN